jgi:hypothetical protein
VWISARYFAWMQRAVAAAVVLFWIVFWAEHDRLPPAIVDFEMCFVLPDLLWIVGSLWIASHWLLAGDARGKIASAAAGSALFYLGLLDVVFNLRHGQYTGSISTGLLNVVVNSGCILFGLANLLFAIVRNKAGRQE